MKRLSRDHDTRRAITTARSPKSVIRRIEPSAALISHRLVEAPSMSGCASHFSSGDKVGLNADILTGIRDPLTLTRSIAAAVSGRAFRRFHSQGPFVRRVGDAKNSVPSRPTIGATTSSVLTMIGSPPSAEVFWRMYAFLRATT